MRTDKLSTNFSRYTDAGFKGKAALIVESMEGNPHFPDPIPTLESIRMLLALYEASLTAAGGLDRVAVAQKNEARKKLAHELGRLALYVMYIADGSEAILTSSGFTLAKKPEASNITTPGVVTIKNGITGGQLISTIKAVKGAKTYVHEITTETPAAGTVWISYNSSRSSYTYSNLIPGTRYYVRVAVLGTGNQKAYSPVADKWAQ